MTQLTTIAGNSADSSDHEETGSFLNKRNIIIVGIIALIALAIWAIWPASRGSFTITAGDSLISHVEFSEAIGLAEGHGLKIIATPLGGTPYEVTPAEALELEDHTAAVRVDVQVFAGDTFDLDEGTFTPGSAR